MTRTQHERRNAAINCVWFVLGFTLGAFAVYGTFIHPPVNTFEIEKARIAAQLDSQCWGEFERKL